MLHIKPTLQDAKLIESNNVIDLRKQGICSSTVWSDCIAVTNTTNGTIVNPVKSGRINSKKGATIKYGRVEVTASLPAGDWLWPAIWMLPVKDTYGVWPQSGEIDIAESRATITPTLKVATTSSPVLYTGDQTPPTTPGGVPM
jgi:beta-glucanase (GH16 family)